MTDSDSPVVIDSTEVTVLGVRELAVGDELRTDHGVLTSLICHAESL